jgi:hypothetical protein
LRKQSRQESTTPLFGRLYPQSGYVGQGASEESLTSETEEDEEEEEEASVGDIKLCSGLK